VVLVGVWGVVVVVCGWWLVGWLGVLVLGEFGFVLNKFRERKIPWTINTDGPYLLDTSLAKECVMLLDANIVTPAELEHTFQVARQASFIPA
jgi:adenosine deaminase